MHIKLQNMKHLSIIFSFLLIGSLSSANSSDSTKKEDTLSTVELGATLTSKNVWRGIDFGNGSPSVLGSITYCYKNKILIGSYFSTAVSGTTVGYANTLNFFLAYRHKNFTFFLDDYYFQGDISNIPTDYWHHDKTHFVESRIEYATKKFSAKITYTVYGGKLYNNPIIDSLGNKLQNTKGLYAEINYNFYKNLSLFAGGITNASALNFHDKGGITNIGLKCTKTLSFSKHEFPIEATITFNPNYKNVSPLNLPRIGYATSAVNAAVSLTF